MFRALRPVLLLLVVAIPAVALRLTGTHPPALASILVFGLAVVAASFVLAWAAEAAEVDISGGLAIALLSRGLRSWPGGFWSAAAGHWLVVYLILGFAG